MRVICTICSRRKSDKPTLMPAYLRYKGPHIKIARETAVKEGLEFLILSGKYGLISGNEMIPYYDYLLTEEAVDDLVKIVEKQLVALEINEIEFYAELKEGKWIPYYEVIERATKATGVKLTSNIIYINNS